MIEAITALVIILMLIFLPAGYKYGQESLCENQFHGEMHEGKCVKVEREELK